MVWLELLDPAVVVQSFLLITEDQLFLRSLIVEEVVHTPEGKKIIENFLYHICQCRGTWTPANFAEESVTRIQQQVGNGKVICALSGGVDSAVAAALIHKAVGDQLTCIFVNNGLLRHEEAQQVVETFERNLKMNLVYVDATEDFLTRLATVVDPEEKRRATRWTIRRR